jgi:3-hydroxymyristoyl/3-hydroxydecanoyl-(acyl carrier protein) dehydratase
VAHRELAERALAMAASARDAHAGYLAVADSAVHTQHRYVELQRALLSACIASEAHASEAHASEASASESTAVGSDAIEPIATQPAARVGPPAAGSWLDRAGCLEFARGSIARALGEAFAPVDAFPTRVRLPDEPLMLVDRILSVTGEPGSMTSGTVVTEHDVREGAWYLDGGRIPTCIAVEAGQADLFLSGWLGVDRVTRGLACYRLLDAAVTFHGSLPAPGSTIHYEIAIDRFAWQGDSVMFFFRFEATTGGQPLLSMRNGCAGFFTQERLAAGRGIVQTALGRARMPGKKPADWRDLVPLARNGAAGAAEASGPGPLAYGAAELDRLRAGDLAGCFGPEFARLPIARPLTIPGGRMRVVHRVVELDAAAGRFGLGLIRAEADIHPDDWFLTCHFVDDMVMPGTLMYECCMHTMRILLMRLGWVGEDGQVAWEPRPGVTSILKCRGQVLASTRVVTYEVVLKEIGYDPAPYAIADALMSADGHPIVQITNMSARLSGTDRQALEALWAGARAQPEIPPAAPPPRKALHSHGQILAFAIGKPSEAFGEPYRPFDSGRVIARLPGPPYMFLDRIVGVAGCRPFVLAPGAVAEAEYDVPPDAWYFDSNRQRSMAFAVLLEVGLQPCGWLAAYVGSCLRSATDLSFRNLGGTATLHREVFPGSGTLATQVKLTATSESGGMIIQHYELAIRDRTGPVYSGTTSFGFFSRKALAEQVGVRGARLYVPAPEEEARTAAPVAPPPALGLEMPDRQLAMFDAVDLFVPDGGAAGLGFVRATKRVVPSEWFFAAHFHQDPVWPGSLGLEAFQQLLKVCARHRWGTGAGGAAGTTAGCALGARLRFQPIGVGVEHTWQYRGQVIPANRTVSVEASITGVDEAARRITGSGHLSVDGLTIYQMSDFSIGLVDDPGPEAG